jgi:hypothetical protein
MRKVGYTGAAAASVLKDREDRSGGDRFDVAKQ